MYKDTITKTSYIEQNSNHNMLLLMMLNICHIENQAVVKVTKIQTHKHQRKSAICLEYFYIVLVYTSIQKKKKMVL